MLCKRRCSLDQVAGQGVQFQGACQGETDDPEITTTRSMVRDDRGGDLCNEWNGDFSGHSCSQRKRNRPNPFLLAKRDRIGEAAFDDFNSEKVVNGVGTARNDPVAPRKAGQLLQKCLTRAKFAFRYWSPIGCVLSD